MKTKTHSQSGFLVRRAVITVAFVATGCSILVGTVLAFFCAEPPVNTSQRMLTLAERVTYQRAIEDVYWRHRIWPQERPDPKPSLDAVMSQAELENKVADYLRNSKALEDYWQQPITSEQLQAEMERMAQHTKQPEVLRELFEALGNDAFVIAECLARPVLSEHLVTSFYAHDKEPLDSSRARVENEMPKLVGVARANYMLPTISDAPSGCIDDTWTATGLIDAPDARIDHTAVWTGSEMIVWGGGGGGIYVNTGGRYNPSTDTWTATSTANAPEARDLHTAVWTGSEMIVWGGAEFTYLNSGGRYNPSTDSWAATSTTNAPEARYLHTAVWTGSEMIVWGGFGETYFNTGGRYNPSTDSWTATSTTNAPEARSNHTAVWTDNEMIVWGGHNGAYFNTGAGYNPSTDSWPSAISTTNAPGGRSNHTAVLTDSEMIVWGGLFHDINGDHYFNTGGRYNFSTDSWRATSTTNAPAARAFHTAVWTVSEMIVWGGFNGSNFLNTGGRYCAQSGATPTPTPTVTATPTATATATTTPTATPRATPTPRPRPTPQPRPTPRT